jgi:hypothetical protein
MLSLLQKARRFIHQTQSSMDKISFSKISRDIITLFRRGQSQSALNGPARQWLKHMQFADKQVDFIP